MADEKFYGYAGSGRPMDEAVHVQKLTRLLDEVTAAGGSTRLMASVVLDSDVIREVKAKAWDEGHCTGDDAPNQYRAITREPEETG